MPETTVCAYCAAVIPANAKICPMCGADNQPDYLEEVVAPPPVAAPFPPFQPEQPEPVEEVVQPYRAEPIQPAPVFPKVQAATPASNNTNRYILIGIIVLVLVCLCIAAVAIAGLRGITGF